MDLADRVVLVTGVRRIGAAVAVEMARRGADVGVSYRRSAAEAERVAAAVSKHGRRSFLGQADLTDESACRRLVDSTVAELGRLDVLINMASSYAPTPFADLTGEDLDRALAVDVKAAFLCTLAAVPHLRAVGGGRVVNVSDWVARSGRPRYPGFLTYYVAKSAVIGMTEALALELAPEQILGKRVDETADIYSIGVIMYEMSTGIPPYSRGDHMSVMYQHVQGKAKSAQEINPNIPDRLAEIINKGMSVDKSKRYQSMDELTDALDSVTV